MIEDKTEQEFGEEFSYCTPAVNAGTLLLLQLSRERRRWVRIMASAHGLDMYDKRKGQAFMPNLSIDGRSCTSFLTPEEILAGFLHAWQRPTLFRHSKQCSSTGYGRRGSFTIYSYDTGEVRIIAKITRLQPKTMPKVCEIVFQYDPPAWIWHIQTRYYRFLYRFSTLMSAVLRRQMDENV